MRVILKRCHVCKALGVGPRAVKLWPFENRLYCKEHYREPLEWDESRGNITLALQIEDANVREAMRRIAKTGYLTKPDVVTPKAIWLAYLYDLCGLAGWALQVSDRRTFVYYFSRALYAWALKREREESSGRAR